MRNFEILYDCYRDDNYPVNHTYGEFYLQKENDLEVIYYITNKFLHHHNLLRYHFIINNGSNVFEIKIGA